MESKSKQAEIAILIFDKVEFKPKLVRRDERSLYINKENNLLKRHNDCKYICAKYWCIQFHKTNTTGHKGTDGYRPTNSG
jgi:hypothetical protein